MEQDTASLHISLPKELRDKVQAHLKEQGYSTPSEYVRALIREDLKRKKEEKLEALLLDGILSGTPIEITPEFWEKKRMKLMEGAKNSRGR